MLSTCAGVRAVWIRRESLQGWSFCVFAGECVFLREGCGVLPGCSWDSVTCLSCRATEHCGTGVEGQIYELVLRSGGTSSFSLTICLTSSLVSSKTLTLRQFSEFCASQAGMEYKS